MQRNAHLQRMQSLWHALQLTHACRGCKLLPAASSVIPAGWAAPHPSDQSRHIAGRRSSQHKLPSAACARACGRANLTVRSTRAVNHTCVWPRWGLLRYRVLCILEVSSQHRVCFKGAGGGHWLYFSMLVDVQQVSDARDSLSCSSCLVGLAASSSFPSPPTAVAAAGSCA